MDLEAEIRDLKRRVGDLEGTVSLLMGQIGKAPDELESLHIQGRRRFDQLETMMQRVVERLDTVNTQVWSLRDDLPLIIRDLLHRSGA